MEYESLIAPVNIVAPFEEYIEPYCKETSGHISELRRKMKVLLKQQGISARSEIRSVWPEYSAEYKKLLSEVVSDDEESDNEGKPFLVGGFDSDRDSQQLTDSTYEPVEYYSVPLLVGQTGLQPPFSVLEEEVDWKINFSQGVKAKDSKLFFFGSILLKLSFGINEQHNRYYLHISPAEVLHTTIRLFCKYRIHDPTTGVAIITQVANDNYTFEAGEQTTAGIDNFAGAEVNGYLDGYKRLSISVGISTELSEQGEMLGMRLPRTAPANP